MGSTSGLTPDEVAERILAIGRDGAVLDLGTGATAISRSLRRMGAIALDPDAPAASNGSSGADLVTLVDRPESLTPELLDRATGTGDRLLVLPPEPGDGRVLADLAAHLGQRSFHRRPDPDVVRISPAAMLFAREEAAPADLVQRYEKVVADVVRACDDDRRAMLDEVVAARHSLLVNRDHVVGTEAEIGRINRDVLRLTQELATSKKRVRALTRRRDELSERVQALRARLAAAQERSATLSARVKELERQAGGSASRRLARRLVGRRG